MNNRYGVNVLYFTKELAALSRSLPDLTPDELNRYLLHLADVAQPLKSVERRKTVRAKRPVQQRKGEICLCCGGNGRVSDTNNGGTAPCPHCQGIGKLSPVA